MKKVTVVGAVIILILVGGWWYGQRAASHPIKVYVAAEGDGKIAVVEPIKQKVIRNIDLSVEHEGGILTFAPHNVQVTPSGKFVLVTANAGAHEEHGAWGPTRVRAHGDETTTERDELIVIDPRKDRIVNRIPIGPGLHLAHVVAHTGDDWVYITAQEADAVYAVSLQAEVAPRPIATFPPGSEPHGIRLSPDGKTAYVALLQGRGLGIVNLETRGELQVVPLDGQAVQTGVTPDGRYVAVSLYDSRKLAIYEPASGAVRYVDLPPSSRGPIQMYSTPDSRFVYLADQGHYFNQPSGDRVYKIDLTTAQVVKEIKAGEGPHGVAVSLDGEKVFVTNLLSGDLSVIDTASDEEVARIPVGQEPNGVTVWSANINQ